MEGPAQRDRARRRLESGVFRALLREEIDIGLAENLFGRHAEHVLDGAAAVGVAAVLILLPQPIAGHVGDLPETLFALEQRLLVALLFGDILLHGEIMGDLAVRVAQGRDDFGSPIELAVLSSVLDLSAPFNAGANALPKPPILIALGPLRLKHPRVPADELMRRVAGQAGEAAVHIFDFAMLIGDHHRDRTLLDGGGKRQQPVFGALEPRQIMGDADEVARSFEPDFADRQIHREGGAVLASPDDLSADANDLLDAGSPVGGEITVMRLAIGRRHQQLDVPSERFLGAVAEQLLRASAEEQYVAGLVDHDETIDHAAEDGFELFRRLVERIGLIRPVDRTKFEQRSAIAIAGKRVDLAANVKRWSILAPNAQRQPLAAVQRGRRRLEIIGVWRENPRKERLAAKLPFAIARETFGGSVHRSQGARRFDDAKSFIKSVENGAIGRDRFHALRSSCFRGRAPWLSRPLHALRRAAAISGVACVDQGVQLGDERCEGRQRR